MFGSCCCYHYLNFNGTDKCLARKGWFLLAMDYILQVILIHTILVHKSGPFVMTNLLPCL